MTPIDPKLLALAKSLRPELAQRLIVMKATEAGRGILIKPPGRPPMPALPPLPSTPDPGAAKSAVLPRPAPGVSQGPQGVALSAYVDEGARARDPAPGTAAQASGQPAEAERPAFGAAPAEVTVRGVPFATAQLPAGRLTDGDEAADGSSDGGRGRRAPVGRDGDKPASLGPVGRAGLLGLGGAVLLAVTAALLLA